MGRTTRQVTLQAADLPLVLDVGDRNLRINFAADYDVAGDWLLVVRDSRTASGPYDLQVLGTADTGARTVLFPLSAALLDAYVGELDGKPRTQRQGEHAIVHDGRPLFAGQFVVERTVYAP